MTAHREHKTQRGQLLSSMEWSKTGPGRYFVEGFTLVNVAAYHWTATKVSNTQVRGEFASMTDALEWISEQIVNRH